MRVPAIGCQLGALAGIVKSALWLVQEEQRLSAILERRRVIGGVTKRLIQIGQRVFVPAQVHEHESAVGQRPGVRREVGELVEDPERVLVPPRVRVDEAEVVVRWHVSVVQVE